MSPKNLLATIIPMVLLPAALTACVSERQERSRLEAQAKIARAEAEKIALAKVPNGAIKEGELEKEKGRLIWSFDIATPGTTDITEIHVDANNGAVVAMERETTADQAKERRAEAKDKKRKEKDDDDKDEKE